MCSVPLQTLRFLLISNSTINDPYINKPFTLHSQKEQTICNLLMALQYLAWVLGQ